MAEGVIIENAETLEHAIAKAARFYPGTGTVFVIEDVDARKERDALRAELAAERESAESYKQSLTDLHKLHCAALARLKLAGDYIRGRINGKVDEDHDELVRLWRRVVGPDAVAGGGDE